MGIRCLACGTQAPLTSTPLWLRPGVTVDYHATVGGPVMERGLMVREGPELLSGHTWVVWLNEKAGAIAADALTPAAPR